MIMAIDPGRDKCGVVVMNREGELKFQRVIETSNLSRTILEVTNNFDIEVIILGDGTTSKSAKKKISEAISETGKNIAVEVVDEKHTTEEARRFYWKKNPPSGWRRFLPTSMQVPPEPVDDIVAEILARRFLESEQNFRGEL